MTTLPDPNDAAIVQKVMDRIFKRDEQLGFADVRLLESFKGHAHRVMETTVNTVSNFTGVSVNIPDHVARQIVSEGRDAPLVNGHQRPDTEGAVQGFGGVPCCWLSPVLSSHTAADSAARHGWPIRQRRAEVPGQAHRQD